MQRELEDTKSDRDKKIGERDSLLQRLRQQFDIKNLVGAKKEINNIELKLKRRSKKIDQGFRELQENYEL